MDQQERLLIKKIEELRDRIDVIRNEIWWRQAANITDTELINELEQLLREYLRYIREHEEIREQQGIA